MVPQLVIYTATIILIVMMILPGLITAGYFTYKTNFTLKKTQQPRRTQVPLTTKALWLVVSCHGDSPKTTKPLARPWLNNPPITYLLYAPSCA